MNLYLILLFGGIVYPYLLLPAIHWPNYQKNQLSSNTQCTDY